MNVARRAELYSYLPSATFLRRACNGAYHCDLLPTTSGLTQLALRWLPDWPYRRLFGDPNNRTLLMAMAGGLVLAAFVLYGRIPEHAKSENIL